jgi:hypothetical protein
MTAMNAGSLDPMSIVMASLTVCVVDKGPGVKSNFAYIKLNNFL